MPLAILRCALLIVVLATGMFVILLLALIPFRYKGIRLAVWIPMWMSRITSWLFGIQVVCTDSTKFQQHQGLILPNHLSYGDITTLFSVSPVRFLANHGVKTIPFIGWIAFAIDTVFVNRSDRKSLAAAKKKVAEKLHETPRPPLVIFPEGAINNQEEDNLLPFKLGAFKLAVESNLPYLPVIIHYSHPNVCRWLSDSESMYTAMWRLAKDRHRKTATVHPLVSFSPDPAIRANLIAEQTRAFMCKAIEEGNCR
ncbi:MAG: 1-acyl-sn-glycerol-3-phosphate acyltransferase [Bacteroidetes Order II. Incertae sedis bacterium]|nr:1-acyl-sn-glycerol-3-phosphate acyltransferase [Bacteroidetes Order II. bacterium]